MSPAQFIDKLKEAYVAFSKRDADFPCACLCIILDHWERIREQHGFSGLLRLQETLGQLIDSELDVETEVCALNERLLVVLLPQCSLKTAQKQAEKLFQVIAEQRFSLHQDKLALSVSLTLTEFDHRYTSADQVLVNLVVNAERLSADGGNDFKRVRPHVSLKQASVSDRQMLGLLMESLRKDAVKILFQPLMATSEQPFKCFQILPRLVSADGSLIPAAHFVHVAYDAGVLGVLDRWMLQRAVHMLAHEHQLRPVRFLLSQGESLLVSPERRDWLLKQFEKHPEISGKLIVEFTLQDAMANLNGCQAFMDLAKRIGTQVCLSRIDEHSKWDLLEGVLKPDYVKMSPDFVRRLGVAEGLEQRFMLISQAVRLQGTRFIMPMVEDAGIAANLWRTGADYLQGYMIQEEAETLDFGD